MNRDHLKRLETLRKLDAAVAAFQAMLPALRKEAEQRMGVPPGSDAVLEDSIYRLALDVVNSLHEVRNGARGLLAILEKPTDPMKETCRRCHAAPGYPCKAKRGAGQTLTFYHVERVYAARLRDATER